MLQVGDLVTIHLPDGSPPFEDRVKEDGTITLPLIGSMAVVGKTARELGKQLRENYAKVGIVLPPRHEHDLSYDVAGEVKQSGPKAYLANRTVTKAIQAAGGFVEFANKNRIKLIHADGRTEIVNYSQAIKDPGLDRRVIPGDRIVVQRRVEF